MRRGLTDIVFGHIEKNSFALYNSCVKSGCFGLKSFHIYNLDIISSKKRDSGPANACFWTSE